MSIFDSQAKKYQYDFMEEAEVNLTRNLIGPAVVKTKKKQKPEEPLKILKITLKNIK